MAELQTRQGRERYTHPVRYMMPSSWKAQFCPPLRLTQVDMP